MSDKLSQESPRSYENPPDSQRLESQKENEKPLELREIPEEPKEGNNKGKLSVIARKAFDGIVSYLKRNSLYKVKSLSLLAFTGFVVGSAGISVLLSWEKIKIDIQQGDAVPVWIAIGFMTLLVYMLHVDAQAKKRLDIQNYEKEFTQKIIESNLSNKAKKDILLNRK